MKGYKQQKAGKRHKKLVKQGNVDRQEARKKSGVVRYYKEA